MKRPISVQLLSTVFPDDLKRVINILKNPFQWKEGASIHKLETWFEHQFQGYSATSFNSGRSALYAILKSLDIGNGDEVLLQAFTCIVVPNSILWCGAKPVFVDTKKNSFGMSLEDLEKKITPKSKVLIIQHTFGFPDDVKALYAIAKKHSLFVIEDCAHYIPYEENNRSISPVNPGIKSAAIFSFGRDKIVFGIFGGMCLVKDTQLDQRIKKFRNDLPYPGNCWILQQLVYPLLLSLAVRVYLFYNIGKFMIVILQKMNILSKPVSKQELQSYHPQIFPRKLPSALAALALHQVNKLSNLQQRRLEIGQRYTEKISSSIHKPVPAPYPLLRYPILVQDSSKLIIDARKAGIILGNWYKNVVDPAGSNFKSISFEKKAYPHATSLAADVVNLPTAPVMIDEEVDTVIRFINDWQEQRHE